MSLDPPQPAAPLDPAVSEIESATLRAPRRLAIRSPSEGSNFFNGADSAIIHGGSFLGVAHLENHQTYNYTTMLPPGLTGQHPFDSRYSTQVNSEENRHRNTTPPANQRRLTFPRAARMVRAVVRIVRGRAPEQRAPHTRSGNTMERDIFQTYKRHMVPKGYGLPLWIPQCNIQLPVEYRKIGVRIGDVGIVTHEGAFDCLFNICLPQEDPINSLVPDGFVPLNPPLNDRHHIMYFRAFSSDAYLTSEGIQAEHAHPNGIDFVTSQGHDGSILTMPKGAYVQRLANRNHFDEYIAKHASNWYKLANGPLRRGIQNGDLRIVLGCHKSTAWGIATFRQQGQEQGSEPQRLRFNVDPHNVGVRPFFWQNLNGATPVMSKVGPEPGDNDGLFGGQPEELLNQCLFMQTEVVSLSQDAWARVSQDTTVTPESRVEGSATLRFPDSNPQRSGNRANTSPSVRSMENRGRQSAVILADRPQAFSAAVDYSNVVNSFLLQGDVKNKVAVSNENDWMALLQKDEIGWIDPSELIKRLREKTVIYNTSSGLVHSELKNSEVLSAKAISAQAPRLLTKLSQGRSTISDSLLGHHQIALDRLGKVLHEAYALHLNGGSEEKSFPPFLTDASEDLFAFGELLKPFTPEQKCLTTVNEQGNGLSSPQLWQAIDAASSDPCRGRYFKELGDISWKRYLSTNSPADLDETIWLYGKAISFTLPFSLQNLLSVFGICSALYRRFYLKRDLQDLVRLARFQRQLHRVDFQDLVTQLIRATNHPVQGPGESRHQEVSVKLREPDVGGRNVISSNIPREEGHITANVVHLYSDTSNISDIFFHPEAAEGQALTRFHSHVSREEQDPKFDELYALTKNWIEQYFPASSILWLYGPSAMGLVSRVIRQFPSSISEFEIAASFTFSDKAAWNNEINELFPTIAYELASTIPGILDEYRSSMDKETSRKLMNTSLRSQFWNFVIKPMLKVSAAGHIRTVIINGIDRAGYQNAREILTIIAEALDVFRLPLRFIISSNRDTRIQDTFNLPLLSKISRQFFVGIQPSEYLTRAKNSSPTDIFGLQRLLTRHSNSSLSRSKQPANAEVVETLTERSRRNAVYANTVMNFLNTTGETSRAFNEKLKLVLEPTPPISRQQELTGTASFTDLDALFNRILSTHPNSDTLVHALGILLVLHDCAQPQTILHNLFGMSTESFDSVFKVLESLMNFPKLENEQNIHPWRAVKKKLPNKEQRVNSPFLVLALLSLSTTMPTAFTIPLAFRDRVHDAFYDFLVNPERSGRFHIDIPYFHGLMTLTGFRCVVHCMWRPSRHDLRRTGDLSADTWDYLKFHLQDHYAQCSTGVREQVLDEMQHTLKVIARTFGDKSEPSSDARSNVADFFDKVAILIDMMVDDWDAFGEWSHSADKHRYKDFRQAMNSIRDDLFPRRNTLLLRKLSGKLGLDGHGHRERTEGTASVSPNLGTAKGPTAIS